MKEKIKTLFGWIILGIVTLLLLEFGWNLLHIQTCKMPPKEELANLSCEEQVEKIADGCRYIILRWRKVEPGQKDIEACKVYERKN